MRPVLLAAAAALLLAAGPSVTHALGAVSLDLGTEFIKVGLVKPGVPMEIVLNVESQRKTAAVVAMRNGERTFSEPALVTSVLHPTTAVTHLMPLLGQPFESPAVAAYQARFPHLTLERDAVRGTARVLVGGESYPVEELLAMMVEHCMENAAAYAEMPVNDVVFTVPPYYTQAERRALLDVARLAGVKVLQLINSNTAVALNYGVFRRSEFNETAQRYAFYDMGAAATIATVVEYKTVTPPKGSKGSKEPIPTLQVLGVGFDRSLGGTDWDYLVREYLIEQFQKNPKVKGDVRANARAMAKLLKEARRVKTVLSANVDTVAQIEGLFQEVDLRVPVTRETLETLTASLYPRALAPLEQALAAAGVTPADVTQLIVVGGGVRVPKLQQTLLAAMQATELGKSVNGDEAHTLGASFIGAALSKAFRVQKFGVRDVTLYPIELAYSSSSSAAAAAAATAEGATDAAAAAADAAEETVTADGSSEERVRTLFAAGGAYPDRKVFSRRVQDDFAVHVRYGSLAHLPAAALAFIPERNLTTVTLQGVAAAYEGHTQDTAKGVKVHFRLDESGLLAVDKAEAVFERTPEPAAPGVLDSISAFFTGGSGSGDAAAAAAEGEGADSEDSGAKTAETDDTTAKTTAAETDDNTAKTTAAGSDDATSGENADAKPSEDAKPAEEEAAAAAAGDEPADAAKPATATAKPAAAKPAKPTTVKERIALDLVGHGLQELDAETLAAGLERLAAMKRAENEKKENEAAKNRLETFIYRIQDQLENEEFIASSTAAEREKLSEGLAAASAWMEEDGYSAVAADFNARVAELNVTAAAIAFRMAEKEGRADAIKQFKEMLGMCSKAVVTFSNITFNMSSTDAALYNTSLTELGELCNETKAWFADKKKAQDKTAASEDPVLTRAMLTERSARMLREMKALHSMQTRFADKHAKRVEKAAKAAAKAAKEAAKAAEAAAKAAAGADNTEAAEDAEAAAAAEKESAEAATDSENVEQTTTQQQEEKPAGDEADEPRDVDDL